MGKSSAGSRSTPSLVHETRPTTSSAPITISMNSGRRIATFVSPMVPFAPGCAEWWVLHFFQHPVTSAHCCPCVDLRGDDVAIGQVAQAAGSDKLSIVDAGQDLAGGV